MLLRSALLALAATATTVLSATYQVSEGRVQILSSTGSIKYGHSFYKHADSSREAAMNVDDLDTVKFTFTLDLPEGDAAVAPSQLSLVFANPLDAQRALVVPLKLRKANKAKYDIDMARPPAGLLSLGADLAVRLLVASGSPSAPSPLDLSLGVLRLSSASVAKGERQREAERAAAPAEWHVERYEQQPEVTWTFPPGEPAVPAWLSGLAAGGLIIGAPWFLLLTLYGQLRPKLVFDRRPMTAQTHLFLALLASFLLLAVTYWARLRLYQALPWLAGLSLVTSWIGRNALSERHARRTGAVAVKAGKAE